MAVAREIPLTRGAVALVDDTDYERLSQWKWHCSARGYAERRVTVAPGKSRLVKMHRLILGIDGEPDIQGDHANGDKLDNRRVNLRACTSNENRKNVRPARSGYRGVLWRSHAKAFLAYLGHKYLGHFPTARQAARAHDVAAREKHGAFAILNFPEQD